jgi:glutamyl-tRNA synthetase
MSERITRLAPSPTGALHLGNARTFLVNWLLARREGWRVLLRIEDLDGPRVKAGSAGELLAELEWLGLTWDARSDDQSLRGEAYLAALERLIALGRAYPCRCSRRDIERAASAPHREDGLTVYPGTCRPNSHGTTAPRCEDGPGGAGGPADLAEAARPAAYRLLVGDEVIQFHDQFAGPQRFCLAECGGDFVVFKADGLAAYQLAVVVDDAAAGVTDIVRGDDLLDSTPRQLLLQDLLDLFPRPRYWHLPLVTGPDCRRLAKRHGDTRLGHYRSLGTRPETMLGLLGYWCGLLPHRRPAKLTELLDRFDLALLPRGPITFTAEDDRFLLGQS